MESVIRQNGFSRYLTPLNLKVAQSAFSCYTYAMGTWKSKNRHKYLLQYHVIFVCKYKKEITCVKTDI